MEFWGDCLKNFEGSPGEQVATLRCIPYVMKNIVNGFLIFSGTTALIFLIYAGFMLLNSGGDAKKVESAKRTITFAFLGLAIILMSFFIVNFVSFVSGVPCVSFGAVGFDSCPAGT
jgi:hypothetical protein